MRKSKVFDGSEPRLALYSSLILHFRPFRKKSKNRCQKGSQKFRILVQKLILGAPGTSQGSILRIFGCLRLTSKNNDFSNPQKQRKYKNESTLGRPTAPFLIKKHDFWLPFWHRFFDFFQKGRKCEINAEYNAKRGSEPSKTSHFRIDV